MSTGFFGIVVDGQGIEIDDAQIVLHPHDEPLIWSNIRQKTNSDGTFEAVWSCTPGVKFFRMLVSKPGYDGDNRIADANAEKIRVVLSHSSEAFVQQ